MTPDQLLGGLPIFYVQFMWNNKQYRIAQNAIDTTAQDGTKYPYMDGLINFDFSESAQIGGDVEENTVSCQLAIPGVDVIALHNRGLGLDGVACEFGYYIWRNGQIVQTYDNRIVLYRGDIQQPQFGDPNEPNNFVSFSIEAQPYANNQLLLQTGVIDQRFPNRDIDTADGKPYPIVFGMPGNYVANGETRTIYATPAYCTKRYDSHDAHFMIAGHDIVGVGTVDIIDKNGQSTTKTPIRDIDQYGNVYFYVEIVPSDNVAMPGYSGSGDSTEWWVHWNTPALPNRFGDGALTRGGDILLWAMLRSGQNVDIGAFANFSALLNRYQFEGFINDSQVYAWEWLQGNILPLLPIGIRMGANGLRPVLDVLAFIDNIQPTARWYIDADSEIQQITAVTQTTGTDDIYNDVTLQYAFNAYNDGYAGISRCRHIRQTPNDLQNDVAKISVNRYGIRQNVIDTPYVYNGTTADLITQTMVRANGLPRYEFSVVANVQWGYINIGDIILVNAPRLALTNHNCMIVGKRWRGQTWEYKLVYSINPNLDLK